MAEKRDWEKKDKWQKLEHVLETALWAGTPIEEGGGGYPKEEVNKYILKNGYKSMKAFEQAVINRASIGVRAENPATFKGAEKGYFREVANGLSMGLWSKAAPLVRSIINRTPLDYEIELEEANREAYRDMQPVQANVGNIGGAMVTGGALAKAGMKMIPGLTPKAGAPALNYSKEAALEAGLGAGEGAVTALTQGGDVGTGAGIGTGMGIVAPAISRVVSPMVDVAKEGGRIVKEAFGGKPTQSMSEKRAMDKLEESFTDDAISPADRRAKLKEFEDAGMGDTVGIGHLGGENVSQLAKDSQVTKGPARTAVKKQLVKDMESDSERLQKFMQDGLGYNKTGSPQTVDEMMLKMNDDAQPFYDKAFETPMFKSDVVDEVMSHKEFREAYEEAQATNRLDPDGQYMPDLPEEGVPGEWSLYALDQVKKIVNLQRRLPPSAANAPNKKKSKHLGQQVNILLGALDEVSGDYKIARNLWGDGAGEVDAYELGMSAYKTSKKPAQVEYEFNKLETDAEKEMYRLGASTEAVAKIDDAVSPTKSHSKVFSSESNKKKHAILFGNEEETAKFQQRLKLLTEMHQKAGDQIPRSDSGANLSRFVGRAWDLVSNTRGGNIISKGAGLIADPLQMAQQRSTNKALGQMLAERGGQVPMVDPNYGYLGQQSKPARTLQNMENRQKELSQNMLNRSLLTGGITGAGAHLLGGKDKKQGSLLETSY